MRVIFFSKGININISVFLTLKNQIFIPKVVLEKIREYTKITIDDIDDILYIIYINKN